MVVHGICFQAECIARAAPVIDFRQTVDRVFPQLFQHVHLRLKKLRGGRAPCRGRGAIRGQHGGAGRIGNRGLVMRLSPSPLRSRASTLAKKKRCSP